MLEIEFKTTKGKRKLSSNGHCYTLCKEVKSVNSGTGKTDITYPAMLWLSTFDQAVKAMFDLKLRESDARSFNDTSELVKVFRKELKELKSVFSDVLPT